MSTEEEASDSSQYVCPKCQSYISNEPPREIKTSLPCSVCLGLWEATSLADAIEQACQPYGGIQKNRFCTLTNHTPTLSIAGDVSLRYRERKTSVAKPYSVFQQDLKQHLHQKLDSILGLHSNNPPPPILSNAEQQGYLSVHVLCVPPKGHSILDHSNTHSSHPKKKRKRSRQRPFTTQGGDPRVNLERRLQDEGYQWCTLAEAEEIKTLSTIPPSGKPMEIHVAVFRRPIYLSGYYTKCRRDISQTPFVVVDNNESTTLGVSSVEEEISRPIKELLGVSTRNNHADDSMQYGMCKFHASGREDMDVRMLLRPNTPTSSSKGRPFCIQLIDALLPLESEQQLDQIVERINGGQGESSPLWYGTNPMGVGISPQLRLVPSSTFSNLQADTESKVKHYGCHCWSEQELPENWTFHSPEPLTIQQRTPMRVLHRRSNLIRERQVLNVHATRVDYHHFRLELSTQAGTYVKEFVHGDLRRTTPSMASLLGTKTNLLLLDCEGIEMDDTSK